jgi:IS4 transposase
LTAPKNDENINWRTLLLLHAKRFMYLTTKNIHLRGGGVTAFIFDDSLLEKTGKKTERVSVVNDHVSKRFILGYKLLVCGFWDGKSFIPLDFSLHREKGRRQEGLIKIYNKASKEYQKAKTALQKRALTLQKEEDKLLISKGLCEKSKTKTAKSKLKRRENSYIKAETRYNQTKKDFCSKEKSMNGSKRKIKRYYSKERLFGLTPKERKEQYKKIVSKNSFGHLRRKETDIDKISSTINMMKRVIRKGIVADYLLTDSWFFCHKLLGAVNNMKKGAIKIISMVKMNNQLFTICKTGKQINVKKIPEIYRAQVKECRKLKSKYLKVACTYKGIRTNLFFVKMGKAQTWHLLATTDLKLGFIRLMEIYQIRWSIEVFFKECKQYLNLGGCESSNFDAQIADTTISMVQHIMLTYYKRIYYQQSLGGIFENLQKEQVQLDLVTKIIEILRELINCLCDISGIDYMEFQKDLIQNESVLKTFSKLLPKRFAMAA